MAIAAAGMTHIRHFLFRLPIQDVPQHVHASFRLDGNACQHALLMDEANHLFGVSPGFRIPGRIVGGV